MADGEVAAKPEGMQGRKGHGAESTEGARRDRSRTTWESTLQLMDRQIAGRAGPRLRPAGYGGQVGGQATPAAPSDAEYMKLCFCT